MKQLTFADGLLALGLAVGLVLPRVFGQSCDWTEGGTVSQSAGLD